MGLIDIVKRSFMEGFTSADIHLSFILIALTIASVLGIYIFYVYKMTTRKSFNNRNFNIASSLIVVITCAIVLTIQSNIVVSLGMIGALSIVRFRTVIKDPLDLVFIFWAIAVGISCGAGLAQIAILMSLIITLGLFLLNVLPVSKVPTLLIINADDYNLEGEIMAVVNEFSSTSKVKSRGLTMKSLNLVIEVKGKENQSFVAKLMKLNGVQSVSMIQHDGEATF